MVTAFPPSPIDSSNSRWNKADNNLGRTSILAPMESWVVGDKTVLTWYLTLGHDSVIAMQQLAASPTLSLDRRQASMPIESSSVLQYQPMIHCWHMRLGGQSSSSIVCVRPVVEERVAVCLVCYSPTRPTCSEGVGHELRRYAGVSWPLLPHRHKA